MIKNIIERTESAVSPVIGVLLMLVVTIIIAAIVSGFAGGMAGGEKEAPQAAISVTFPYNETSGMGNVNSPIYFKLMSGNPISTKDLSIITYFTNSSGYTYKHEQTASSDLVDVYPGYNYNTRVPYLQNLGKGWANEANMHFGNFTWAVGDILTTGTNPGSASLLGMLDYYTEKGTLDPDLKTGSIVEIKIKHIPSNKFIYDKEVMLS
ncbi:type IV pilin N-terminal domain-containing protein [Methanospirillum purgamenti]|uniref:Type IV pilin N-terminal domain-containing protein n=2 Tax=Methanospirillum TaxID=2202 RepID=A0A8F5ZG98_METHU|nr:type IV pilin N-terminal domain-containing protein [Methanospirillum hungatei]